MYQKFCEGCEKETLHRYLNCEECADGDCSCIFICSECGEADEEDNFRATRRKRINKLREKIGRVQVRLTRTYEVEFNTLLENLDKDDLISFSDEKLTQALKEKASRIAFEMFYEEVLFFAEDLENFVGATAQIIPPEEIEWTQQIKHLPLVEVEEKQPIEYQANVRADFISTLPAEEIREKLVLALWNGDRTPITADGASREFEILDYHFTDVVPLKNERESSKL